MRVFVSIILILSLCGVALAQDQQPQAVDRTLVDRVVAVVEDDPVFMSEVVQAVKQVLVQRGVTDVAPEARAELERQALNELINSRLIVAKASRLGIDVSFSEVERYVERAIEENVKTLGGQAAFERQLAAENLTLDELKQLYRDQIRNRMIVERVLSTEINRGKLQVTDEELRDAYEARKGELPERPAVVHLSTIYLSFESADNAVSAAKARADSIYERIVAGEDFAELAREYSEDPSAESGGVLGTVRPEDLADPAFSAAASSLDIGEVSKPVKTQYGYHLIMVTGKHPDTGEVDLSHILIRAKAGEEDVQGVYARAQRIHDQLVAGAPFDSLAREYSDDAASAEAGGDLGWLRVGDLPEFFREVLGGMQPGEISQVLREPNGFRIVKLLESEAARPFTFEEVRDDLRKSVEQEKLAESYDRYVDGLRDEFYVDVRTE